MAWDISSRSILYDPELTVSTAQAPSIVNVGGTLVASFMTNEDTPSDTDGDADGGSFKIVSASASASDLVWGNKATISTGAHWPGLFDVDESYFLALYGASTGILSREYAVSS